MRNVLGEASEYVPQRILGNVLYLSYRKLHIVYKKLQIFLAMGIGCVDRLLLRSFLGHLCHMERMHHAWPYIQ